MTPLRMLFCSPVPVDLRLGAAKVYVEVAAAVRQLGCETTVVGPDETGPLRDYLRAHAAQYDVVEYEHNRLPFPRSDFPARTLFVARSVLLTHHHLDLPIPLRPGLRARVGHWLFGRSRRRRVERFAAAATTTCREADLVNVPNPDDVVALAAHGVPSENVLVLPFGLTADRRAALARAAAAPPTPTIAFVGTFDPRKGMRDFPQIVGQVCNAIPAARFKLIGTRGMLHTADEVMAVFPHRFRPRIEVIPAFDPADLPGLLAGCAVGVFPSAIEGFPFSVLEMLAAGLPVVAYRVPGPPVMLPDDYLASRGDTATVADKLIALLGDPARLTAARAWAMARAADFRWEDIARRTLDRYSRELAPRRAGKTPESVG
jgi:glycosyltransferase involved in cell wall biosynthesis